MISFIKRILRLHILLLVLEFTCATTVDYETSNYAPNHEYNEHDYSFSYGVKDVHTGDIKHQWEKKEGDTIKGHYSMLEPDGSVRIVDYTADKHNGFNAIVKHNGPSQHPSMQPLIQPPKPPPQPVHVDYKIINNKHESGYEYGESKQPDETYSYQEQEQLPEEEQEEEGHQVASASTASPIVFIRPNRNRNEEFLDIRNDQEQKQQRVQYERLKQASLEYMFEDTLPLLKQQREERKKVKDSQKVNSEKKEVKITTSKPQFEIYVAHNESNPKNLPIQIQLLKGNEDVIPVEVTAIKPIEIKLVPKAKTQKPIKYSDQDSSLLVPSYQLSKEEENYFLQDLNKFVVPYLEKGFQPLKPLPAIKPPSYSLQNLVPPVGGGTYKSGKKPTNTPGLRNYATNNRLKNPIKNRTHNRIAKSAFYNLKDDLRQADILNLYHTMTNNGYTRYAKHITFQDDN